MRNFCLSRAADDDLQRLVKVIQELHDSREDSSRLGGYFSTVFARGRVVLRCGDMSVDLFLQDGVEEDLERVRKVDEVLVMRGEEDGFLGLIFGEMEAEDVVNK